MASSEKKEEINQQASPWAPQAGALTSAFADAQNAYGTASKAVAPTDFTASFDPSQLATFKSMLGYANGNNTPATTASTGAALQGAGTAATTGALSGLSAFDPTKANNTQSLIDSANKYVAGQDIDGQVRDAMHTATETARDVTMPGIEQNAALTGNTNSSRTGIADGLVQRGLAEQSTNLGATLRNKAFTDGLGLASNTAQSNNASSLGAITAAASAGNAATNTGVNAGSTSIIDQGNLYTLANGGASGLTAAQQAQLNNAQQQYQSNVNAPYAPLNGLMSIIGSQNWGKNTTGTNTTTTTPSAFSVIGGLLGMGGQAKGLFG
jgi:hypothetical protein